ncbi:MAG: serine hydrolase family protein [Campylobacteraceae bacterium]|nr:serine hydrolase family protein [Campylobacteraceae bacterium]MBT3882612.1 serine hydrolase family protein [Campylobacteraceae bacterium]MBT4031051.1 serine hydrolase family protein [Campylobacteraceae bacterium]MBT4179134.1 serine hydrolase family protein [Campylobacteraceae bacterium]MBT4571786.1 serine hydrolase family protein [Campylobacteraceae bacterium]
MMKKVLILHGWGGSDFPHWQAWSASELIKENYTVSFPQLPNKDFPDFNEWMKYLEKEFNHFKPDIVVCHSLANILWFHFVNKFNIEPIDKLMLVAPVTQKCDIEELKTFFPYPIVNDLKAKEIIMVGSTNDPYMSVDEAIDLQSSLNIGLKILDDAGHINADSGFGELSCVVDWIKREIE